MRKTPGFARRARVLLSLAVAGSAAFGVTLENLGLHTAGDYSFSLSGQRVAVVVFEAGQGATDLNADGDWNDGVLHVYDAQTGVMENLGISAASPSWISETQVVFLVPEQNQGDRNGDGDPDDLILHVYDVATGVIHDLGLDSSFGYWLDGPRVAFRVSELNQGESDLNDDADTADQVLHVYDTQTGAVANTRLDANDGHWLEGAFVAILVSEQSEGVSDLNGDGDVNDSVLHVYDLQIGAAENLGLAASNLWFDGTRLAFSVPELGQGATDRNGDGDASDSVLHLYDAQTGTVKNLGLDASSGYWLDGTRLAIRVNETRQGASDRNGDGDDDDAVLHLYDAQTDAVLNLRLDATAGYWLDSTGFLAIRVKESNQGLTDLNGDGDVNDAVLHVHDAQTGVTRNVGLDSNSGYWLDGARAAILVYEWNQGVTDLNGDGDSFDVVLHTYDAQTGSSENVGLDALAGYWLDGGLVAFLVDETSQGATDLNGDGDVTDFVLHLYDTASDTVENLGRDALAGFWLDGAHVAFLVNEQRQGASDLNGDGDRSDRVLHLYDASTGAVENLGVETTDYELHGAVLAAIIPERDQGATDLNGDADASDTVLHLVAPDVIPAVTSLPDLDHDSVADAGDNCPTVPNPDQVDVNRDGHGDACVSPDLQILAGSTLGERPIVGRGSRIGKSVTIGDDITIGSRVRIEDGVTIGDNVTIGNDSVIRKKAIIGDNVTIGTKVTIEEGARIGAGATLGDRVKVGRNAIVKPDAVVPAGTSTAANKTYG